METQASGAKRTKNKNVDGRASLGMSAPDETTCESERLQSLRTLDLLDTESEERYNDLIRLASYICSTPIGLLSLVDQDRQWFKAKLGISIDGTPRSESICSHTIRQHDLLIVEDATEDERFRQMPLVESGVVRFYAGTPICSPEGHNIGSLCVIDNKPRTLTQEQKDALEVLGRQAAAYLVIRRQMQKLLLGAEECKQVEQQLREKQRELEEVNGKLQELASTDPLTGLTNRRALETSMSAQRTAPNQNAAALSVLMMDVDHFKVINDTQSHEAGDEVLRQLAKLLRKGARESDTLSRYGGEEFVLVMPGISHEAALARAERLRAMVAEGSPVTISIGVATAQSSGNGLSVSDLLADADRALYVAKREGRNCVRSALALRPRVEAAVAALAS